MQRVIENQKKIEERQALIVSRRERRIMPMEWILRQRTTGSRMNNGRNRRLEVQIN
jgi:hypothetical protein